MLHRLFRITVIAFLSFFSTILSPAFSNGDDAESTCNTSITLAMQGYMKGDISKANRIYSTLPQSDKIAKGLKSDYWKLSVLLEIRKDIINSSLLNVAKEYLRMEASESYSLRIYIKLIEWRSAIQSDRSEAALKALQEAYHISLKCEEPYLKYYTSFIYALALSELPPKNWTVQ